MKRIFLSKWTKVLLFLASLAPAFYLGWRYYKEDLTANPVEYITHFTGDWAIRFIVITLAVTPLRGILNEPSITRFRRMLGLFAFFYGMAHLTTWAWIDKFFDWNEMLKDILKRKFITIGMTSLLLMLPLAITSTAGWVRRMGFKNWQRLHRLIYFSALAAVIHYYWLVKSDVRLPLMYGAILAVLMAYRAVVWMRKPAKARPVAQAVRQSAE